MDAACLDQGEANSLEEARTERFIETEVRSSWRQLAVVGGGCCWTGGIGVKLQVTKKVRAGAGLGTEYLQQSKAQQSSVSRRPLQHLRDGAETRQYLRDVAGQCVRRSTNKYRLPALGQKWWHAGTWVPW